MLGESEPRGWYRTANVAPAWGGFITSEAIIQRLRSQDSEECRGCRIRREVTSQKDAVTGDLRQVLTTNRSTSPD